MKIKKLSKLMACPFAKIYRKFIRRNTKDLGEFFIEETKDIINQLCDDFENTLTKKDIVDGLELPERPKPPKK